MCRIGRRVPKDKKLVKKIFITREERVNNVRSLEEGKGWGVLVDPGPI